MAWYIVSVLFVLYLLSLLDRLVISFLVGPIRRDLGITDFELSLLQGFAFGAFYALCGLPLGWMVDRFSRRRIVFWGVTIWSVATVACGFARNYHQLLLARIGVGAGEASLSPAAYSILADSFPPHRLTTALTVYSLGSLVGSCLAFMVGGYLVGLVSAHESIVLPMVGEVRAWQMVFLAVGLPGTLLGLLAFTFSEPRRQVAKSTLKEARGHANATFVGFFKTRRRFIFFHHAGFTVANIAMTGMVVWAPVYLSRSFAWAPGEIGLALGVTGLVGGLAGALLHGRIADRWFARGVLDAQMRWYAICAIVALPVGVAGMLLNTPVAFLGVFFLINLLIGPIMGIAASSLQLATPAPLRGRVSVLYLFIMILFGIGAGPSVVAALTDFVFRDDGKLGLSLACTFGAAFPLCALLLFLGLKASREAVAANQSGS